MPWYAIVLIIVFAALLLIFILHPFCKGCRCRKTVPDTDAVSRRYVFLLPPELSQISEVIGKLKAANAGDTMRYEFDAFTLQIAFWHCFRRTDYRLLFVPVNGRMYLRLEQLSHISGGMLPCQMTVFFRKKLGAEPVDYSFYERLVNQQ